jgi:ABC-type nitrate/sulfonate/bicarbonate transport system substrate-binding protein
METITVALDWAPNTNHAGLLVAKANGWYQQAGLEVRLISTEVDQYAVYPIQKLVEGQADIAMAPSEHVIYYQCEGKSAEPVAIASVFQKDSSLILIRDQVKPEGPAGLDGKTYLGYQTRFEADVLRHMIIHAGGKGSFNMLNPPKLSLWEAFVQGEGDACWVFEAWEYAKALQSAIKLKGYYLGDYGVPYGYSPVMIARRSALKEKQSLLKEFLQITARGYSFAVNDPLNCALLMREVWPHENTKDPAFTLFGLCLIKNSLLNTQGQWGKMEHHRWDNWLEWLTSNRLVVDQHNYPYAKSDLVTEQFCQNLI